MNEINIYCMLIIFDITSIENNLIRLTIYNANA